LSISITACILAFWLAVTAVIFFFLQFYMGPGGVSIAPGILLIPACITAFTAFVYSRVARLFLLRVPRNVSSARFSATASLVFELLGQTGLGVFIAMRAFGVWIESGVALAWVGVSGIVAIVGGVYFQRSLYKIGLYTMNTQTADALTGTWALAFFGSCLLVFGGIIAVSGVGIEGGLVILGVFGLAGAVVLGIAVVLYSSVVNSILFSALREAVRCEDDSENRD
jgi:hypothetical protein